MGVGGALRGGENVRSEEVEGGRGLNHVRGGEVEGGALTM